MSSCLRGRPEALEAEALNRTVARFLTWARPRARSPHQRIYEDLCVSLDDYFRQRRGPARLRAAEVGPFLNRWYRREGDGLESSLLRRFCAGLRVFTRWQSNLSGTAPTSRRLQAEVARATRATVRAARVTELMDRIPSEPVVPRDSALRDGYWQVVLLGSQHAVLREVGADSTIGPVELPAAVVGELRPGSILNLCLAGNGRHWRVVLHGRCYPALAPAARRASAGPGPA